MQFQKETHLSKILTLHILALGILVLSCGKDEPVETADGCKFLGSTTTLQTNYYSTKYTENNQRDFELRDDNFPLKIIRREESLSRDTVQAKTMIEKVRTSESTFTYDAQGYLTQRNDRSLENSVAGELGNILYEGSSNPVKNLTTETNVQTDFKYENGLLKESTYKETITFKSAPRPDLVKTLESYRTYTYDGQQKLTSIKINDSNGSRSEFKYENGLVKFLLDGAGKTIVTYEYVNGKQSRISYGAGSEMRFEYDSKGNRTRQETVSNNTVFGRTEFTYDSNPNPELLVPTNFKGVPMPLTSVQTSDGVNNLTSEKITQFIGGNPVVSSNYSTTYTYNGQGLPIASKSVISTGQTGVMNTTFRYGNCQ